MQLNTNRTLCLLVCFCFATIVFCEIPIQIYEDETSIIREPRVPKSEMKSMFAVETEWIEQRIDNFDAQNVDTYKMRYMRNDEFVKPGGPIFIYVGGEWTISPGWIRGGHMYNMAKEFHGQLFYTEHRYYGESHPTSNASTANLKYLSIDQALADLAHFIVEKKKEPKLAKSKVILVGGSYAATMAAWFRLKYPHLVVGAWASSGPLFAKSDMFEYKEVVGASVRHIGGAACYDRLDNAFKSAHQLVQNGDLATLKKLFRFCDSFDLTRQENVWRAFGSLGGVMSGTVQYHSPGDIEGRCNALMAVNTTGSDLGDFAKWYVSLYIDDDDNEKCLNYDYDAYVKRYQQTEWGHSVTDASRQWLYQTCTEFGWFHTQSSPSQPFGILYPVDFAFKKCEDIFGKGLITGEKLELETVRKNTIYGGYDPAATNVYYTHGKIDPWRTMGINYGNGIPSSPVVVISTASHCQDLYTISSDDTEEMLAVKFRIRSMVKEWLNL